ncbi:MAG: hypothetical protein K2I49_02585, partial [Ureaplasma sp.]|nr:hypothetical protein [Ureaplasma sp.]
MKIDEIAEDQTIEASKVIGTTLAIVAVAAAIAAAIVALVQNIHKIEYFTYTYNANGFRLIWDGAYQETFFFGLIPGDSKGIDSLKMIDPVKIIEPRFESGYYYNGFIYETESQLERVQYQDMINGIYKPDSVNNAYSFEKIINSRPKDPKLVNNDLNKLADNVYEMAKSYAESKTNKPAFIEDYDYSLEVDGLYSINVSEGYTGTLDKAIDTLIKKIKPVKMAYTPKEVEGKNIPIYRNDLKDDKSIPNFVLPYKSWTSTGGIKENSED